MQIGIDSFAASLPDPSTGQTLPPVRRIANLLDEIALADQVGLDAFGIGEHHRREFLDAAPSILLAAAAARTRRIRLASAVTVLSAADPVRVFQEFATLDLISNGRAEIVAGRGSFTEAYPLFGLRLEDYDELFAEKLDLLLQIRDNPRISWNGRFRPALQDQEIYPRPVQTEMPVWLGVGGTPQSFARAGHAPEKLKVGLHMFGFLGDTTEQAADDFYPGYAAMMSRIGRERGWPPITREQYDHTRSPKGAFLIGDPETVVEKILYTNEVLGGVARIDFQMTAASMAPEKMRHAIELLGTHVAPAVRKALGVSPDEA